ncbi:hypothetical protein [Streptomyces noursei]|uniref:Uncharacterized protein n=1 Tax=Streptomyces noursei TaxID=1971 RepID=A0A401QRR4_STRNR|nr:hypothetical protein [Streptomyces noursei]GCB88096.1 hypothetical protein SALB_00765 [Streptomyces noursei]
MSTTPLYGQLALPASEMAVYSLNHLPYPEQLRWRAQRCSLHAAALQAADLAPAEWELFDPLLHAEHICTRLPHTPTRTPRHR